MHFYGMCFDTHKNALIENLVILFVFFCAVEPIYSFFKPIGFFDLIHIGSRGVAVVENMVIIQVVVNRYFATLRFNPNCQILNKVTRQSSEVTRRQPTFKQLFLTFQAEGQNFEKSRWTVTDSCRRPCDRRLIRQTIYFDVSAKLAKFWKSLNGHATVRDIMVIKMMNFPFSTFQNERIHKAVRTIIWMT